MTIVCIHGSYMYAIYNLMQGVPQYVTLDLGRPAVTRELCVRFQGGFAGKECALMGGETEENLREIAQFYPTDSNSLQVSWRVSMLECLVGHRGFLGKIISLHSKRSRCWQGARFMP